MMADNLFVQKQVPPPVVKRPVTNIENISDEINNRDKMQKINDEENNTNGNAAKIYLTRQVDDKDMYTISNLPRSSAKDENMIPSKPNNNECEILNSTTTTTTTTVTPNIYVPKLVDGTTNIAKNIVNLISYDNGKNTSECSKATSQKGTFTLTHLFIIFVHI